MKYLTWTTRSGDRIPIDEMSDSHLLAAIKYIGTKTPEIKNVLLPYLNDMKRVVAHRKIKLSSIFKK